MRKIVSFLVIAALCGTFAPMPAFAATGTFVRVSEKLPGSNCKAVPVKAQVTDVNGNATTLTVTESDKALWPRYQTYECEVKPGFGGFFDALRGLLKYGILIGLLFGVLMIVVAGIRISTSEAAEGLGMGDQRTDAKMMLIKVISGIVALALVGFILNTVAPWVFTG